MHSLFNGRFLESCGIVLGSALVNGDANSDITGDRIRLDGYDGCAVVVLKPAGTAGDDLSFDFDQHDAATSGNSKALTAVHDLWFNLGATTLAAAQGWVYATVTPTDAIVTDVLVGGLVKFSSNATYVPGAALVDIVSDTNDAIIVFDIKASDLDGGNGYRWFSMNSAGAAIGNALLINVLYIPYASKYGGLLPPNIIA